MMSEMKNKFFKLGLLLSIPLIISSCGQGEEESAIAKNITFTVTKKPIVLPNSLHSGTDEAPPQTCVGGGITGPRVRMKGTIEWKGEGNLVPLVILISGSDQRLSGDIEQTLSSGAADSESFATIFDGILTDYIPPGAGELATTSCFFDFGSLPKPSQALKGSATLEIPVTLQISGYVVDSNGAETPFIKITNSTLVYVAGSVPIN